MYLMNIKYQNPPNEQTYDLWALHEDCSELCAIGLPITPKDNKLNMPVFLFRMTYLMLEIGATTK